LGKSRKSQSQHGGDELAATKINNIETTKAENRKIVGSSILKK
jgi:hypothetical protein